MYSLSSQDSQFFLEQLCKSRGLLLKHLTCILCDDLIRYEIVEGEHQLWDNVSGPYRETIRAFLVHFQCQVTLLNQLAC